MSTTSQARSTAYAVMQRIFEEGFATGNGSVAGGKALFEDPLHHRVRGRAGLAGG